ncbi:PSP1 domain-containing protein [Ekhidna sp.]|uniref:PSP1 domain-containing protein n=1 Tax=Ekhidna sp. TaxID=2608089 RepID=UPI003CCBA49B
MGCASCGTGGSAGCKNNGHCSTGGCNKLNVFDWLSNMDVPAMHRFDVVEVRFKNGRKDFYRNAKKLDIVTGDPVVLDVPNGHHIGYVSLQGELVRLQMSKKGIKDNDEVREIYRKATTRDMERWEEARNREESVMYRTKEIIQDTKLEMKLTDVEFQADGTKATFFYSAEGRVDFRELIKILAGEFKIRVEMRQISVRQEAGRIGGIGVCGRELCCSTWLTDFKNVSTSAARYQNLSLNPSKLSGQCGRLKCCLNYELDTYTEALKDIPEVEEPLITQRGKAKLQKTDIFRKIMWFGYDDDNNWHAVDVGRVKEIQTLNKKGEKPASLQEDEIEVDNLETGKINSDLEAMDKKFSGKGKKKKKKKRNKFRGKKPKNKKPEQS